VRRAAGIPDPISEGARGLFKTARGTTGPKSTTALVCYARKDPIARGTCRWYHADLRFPGPVAARHPAGETLQILIKAIVSDVAFATVWGPPGVSLMTSTKGTIKRLVVDKSFGSSRTTMAANTSSTTLPARHAVR
jgi:hypothetical protein